MPKEIFAFLMVTIVCTLYLLMKRRLFSSGILTLAAIVFTYTILVAIYRHDVDINTMVWPVSNEVLIEIAWILFIFVIVFFLVNLLVYGFLGKKRSRLSFTRNGPSVKSLQIAFFLAMGSAIFLLVLTAEGWWIFARYPTNRKIWSDLEIGGAGFLVMLVFLFGFRNGLMLGHSYKRAAITIILLACGHYILSGDRGSLLFISIGGFFLYFLSVNKVKRGRLMKVVVLGSIPFVVFLDKISTWRAWGESEESTGLVGFLSEIDLLPATLGHTYHSIVVVSNYGTHFDNMVEFFVQFLIQIIPGPVLSYLGVELYLGAWRLADYVNHGGGFFVPAEMYFVGGYTGLVSISIYFSFISVINDRILVGMFQDGVDTALGRGEVVVACLALGSLPYAFFYGLQGFHRMILLPVLFVIFKRFLSRVSTPSY